MPASAMRELQHLCHSEPTSDCHLGSCILWMCSYASEVLQLVEQRLTFLQCEDTVASDAQEGRTCAVAHPNYEADIRGRRNCGVL